MNSVIQIYAGDSEFSKSERQDRGEWGRPDAIQQWSFMIKRRKSRLLNLQAFEEEMIISIYLKWKKKE